MHRHFCALLCGLLPLVQASAGLGDVPSSVGAVGALERSSVSSAGPGSFTPQFDPVRESGSRFSVRLLYPFLQVGDPSREVDVLPVAQVPEGFSALIPQLEFGAASRVYRVQLGVLATSVGHGTIVRNFTNSPNGLPRRIGGYGALRIGGLEGEVLLGDVLAPSLLLAGRAAVRPLAIFWSGDVGMQPVEFDHAFLTQALRRWVFGVTGAVDLVAPVADANLLGSRLGPVAAFGAENQIIGLDDDRGRALVYIDVNGLYRQGQLPGAGTHVGVELGAQPLDLTLKTQIEFVFAGQGYVPGYFDQTYVFEREALFGTTLAKGLVDAPASWGWHGSVAISYQPNATFSSIPSVSLVVLGSDLTPLDPTQGTSNARLATAIAAKWLFLSGSMQLSQSGVRDFTKEAFGAGTMFVVEGRLSLFFQYLELVGRYFRLHEATAPLVRDFRPVEGGFAGLEVNLTL